MQRANSNDIVTGLNCLTILFSIGLLSGEIWAVDHAEAAVDCEKYLQKPTVCLAGILIAVSLAGIVGACYRRNWLIGLHLLAISLLIVALLCFTVFAFLVTSNGGGAYSTWLQKRVSNDIKNWNRVKTCLADGNFCAKVNESIPVDSVEYEFLPKKLSPAIESGCCKPPKSCIHSNSTTDKKVNQEYCDEWSNEPKSLCFNCHSCKVAMFRNLKTHWKCLGIYNIFFILYLIVSCSMGCFAICDNRRDNYQRQKELLAIRIMNQTHNYK